MPLNQRLLKASTAPGTSFLDDIIFYARHHSQALKLDDHTSLCVFAEKIVVGHYLKLTEYLQAVIESVQLDLLP